MHDVIVVGGGPAGMTAALYALRNGKSVLLMEKEGFGGQITHSPRVENFPGTIEISGAALADHMMEQILHQGADIELETVKGISGEGGHFTVTGETGTEYEAKAVVIATGVYHRMLWIDGEEELIGEGVSYCAVCDGDFYTDRPVCVVGGGNSALQEAILLAGKCSEVTVLQDLPELTGEAKLQEILLSRDNVRVLTNTKVLRFITDNNAAGGGTGVGTFMGVEARVGNSVREIACDGVFVAIGLIPQNDDFEEIADLTEDGYFRADESCRTKTPGVFVAGDCRNKEVRQLTTAVSDGAAAALAACAYIDGLPA